MQWVEITIAVLTFRRQDELTGLLRSLADHIETSAVDASVLVVDNDNEPSARAVVAGMPGVRYVHEPRPGIAAARNRALNEAGSHRLLIFIDDDERPEPGWLHSLVGCWHTTRPAAVVGPVISRCTVPPDPWIEAGGFFRRPRRPTGTEVPVAATNNLLLDLDAIRSYGLRFDERFGLSGGSDTFFSRSLVREGGRIVWCDEAIVIDVVPPERLTRDWVLRRATRMANSWSRVSVLMAQPGWARCLVRARLTASASSRLAVGGARMAVGGLVGDQRHSARGARTFARGRGMLMGALGSVVVEYARPTQPEPHCEPPVPVTDEVVR